MREVMKTINGTEYLFINNSRGNRSGFVHESELYRNNRLIGKNKVQYYNRTWEVYTYQTVMKGLVSGLMEDYKEDYKSTWKDEHGIKRLTEAKRKAMMEDFEKNPPELYAELFEVYSKL